jgi:hypothetical protein
VHGGISKKKFLDHFSLSFLGKETKISPIFHFERVKDSLISCILCVNKLMEVLSSMRQIIKSKTYSFSRKIPSGLCYFSNKIMQSRYKVCLAEDGYSKCVFMSVAEETVRYLLFASDSGV